MFYFISFLFFKKKERKRERERENMTANDNPCLLEFIDTTLIQTDFSFDNHPINQTQQS